MEHGTHFVGKAGEYAVASQLLLRDVPVFFPAVDSGIDLVAGTSVRIQVKSARAYDRGKASTYVFNLGSTKITNRKFYKERRDWSKFVEFFVFWGIDENRFWICPSHLVKGQMVCLGVVSNRFTVDPLRVKALASTGMLQRDIARTLQISEMSVSRAVNGIAPKGQPGVSYEIARRENAWHEILSAVGLASEVNSIPAQETYERISINA